MDQRTVMRQLRVAAYCRVSTEEEEQQSTLPVGIAQSFLGEYSNDYGGLMAFAVAGSLPIVLLFIFFQKYLVSGMTAGAVKG